MFNSKGHIQIGLWCARFLIIIFFSIGAITMSTSVVHIQKVIKEQYFKKSPKKEYKETIREFKETDLPETPMDEVEYIDTEQKTHTNRKIKIAEEKNFLNSIILLLSNSWITVVFYLICILIIVCFIYKYVRKQIRKKRKHPKTYHTSNQKINTEKKGGIINKPLNQLPTDPVRIKLIEWEQTLQLHEKRRSHESIQQWLYRICRTRDIIPIYESIRYGNKPSSEIDVEKTVLWIQQNKKTE
ncbi:MULTISPECIES: hypothetical protein [Bacillus cereus group]|uniref:Signal peptidase II n=1 Tax=Bacillus cytotoxicus (strain DSM 22905 / CIP 110041 / 391-98 / NVH 391-98) TaxID=315749 RepID=A7GKM2_BACCN|nr:MULTISPECIES: hypothetical protein [Bacillus cereus group]ABS20680.1 conserved hypothetical protein [Bacillus cytotoxicus NVH 391-98]AWC43424.1 hypothetical protein CG479_001930 [Bacillus cytotoxicus]MDH2865938.1 hypothetical protein [Bacillus cytotoxicus]MDH2882618.1 hypothetical protein [Bacillus cytotoxicus]MDH2885991.1 hypothetical protein [Bacillus cytotoxicus]